MFYARTTPGTEDWEIRVSLDGNGENGGEGTGSSAFKSPEKFGEQAFVDSEV